MVTRAKLLRVIGNNYQQVNMIGKIIQLTIMQDWEMIGYQSQRLRDRDIQGDISANRITLQVLAPEI